MTQAEIIAEVLGGPKVLGRAVASLRDMTDLVRAGLPYVALDNLVKITGLSRKEVSTSLHIPERTLVRRKRQQQLDTLESDRLFRLARVVARAVQVFGDRDKAKEWLHRPCRALGSVIPLSLMDTDSGASEVEQELGRIEHGIIA